MKFIQIHRQSAKLQQFEYNFEKKKANIKPSKSENKKNNKLEEKANIKPYKIENRNEHNLG